MRRFLLTLLGVLFAWPLGAANPTPAPTFSPLGRSFVRQTTAADMRTLIGAGTGSGGSADTSTLTNVFHVADYGAVGNGTTVDDAAVSNAWRAAWLAGGVFSMEGKGKVYVISNFVFSTVSSSPGLGGYGAPLLRGGGSQIRHVGTNYLMRFTNAAPDIDGLHVLGNQSAAGGLLILGPPSNGRMVGISIIGYTNGTGIMAEGLTAWTVQAAVNSCYRGFGFGAYCDGSDMTLRVDRCALGVDTGCTNALWQYTTAGPVGGRWTVVGNYNGDNVITPGRGVLEVQMAMESCTNAFVTFGHNLARHGYDNTAQGAGTLVLNLAGGFGNPAHAGTVPANWTNAPIELNCIGTIYGRGQIYGTGWTNGWFLSRNSQADTCALSWNGSFNSFSMVTFFQLSTGERIKFRNTTMDHAYNQPIRILHTDQGSLSSGYDIPVLGVYTKNATLAADAARIGYVGDASGTNFAGGLRIYYAGGPQIQVTNAPLEVRSAATFTSTIAAQGILTAGTGGGSPGPGGTLIDVTGSGQTTVDIRNGQGELQLLVSGYDAYVGNRSNAKLYLQSNNQSRWQIAADGKLVPMNDGGYDIGQVTSRVGNIYSTNLVGEMIATRTNTAPTGVTVGTTAPDSWFYIAHTNGNTFWFPAWKAH